VVRDATTGVLVVADPKVVTKVVMKAVPAAAGVDARSMGSPKLSSRS